MKKFLSILLAVMMVLSTVSFAAPSLADVADSAAEVPALEAPVVEEEAAELAAEAGDRSAYGKVVFLIDFEKEGLVGWDGRHELDMTSNAGAGERVANIASEYDSSIDENLNLRWASLIHEASPCNDRVVSDGGNTYLTGTASSRWPQWRILNWTPWGAGTYTMGDGIYTYALDLKVDVVNDNLNPVDATGATVVDAWGATTDWDTFAYSYELTDGAALPNNAGAYFTFDAAGATICVDNVALYYRPATVTLTIDGNEYEVSTSEPVTAASLASQVKAPTGYVLSGLSLTEGGETFTEKYFFEDTVLYPTYEIDDTIDVRYGKKIASFSFNDASKFSTELCNDQYSQFSVANVADYNDASHNLAVLQYYVPYTGVPSFTNGYSQSSITGWGSINLVTHSGHTYNEGIYTIAFDLATSSTTGFAITQSSSAFTLLDGYSFTDSNTFDHVVIQVAKDHLAGKNNLQLQFSAAQEILKVDNLEVFYRPNTVDVTLVYNGEEYVAEDVATTGISADTILAAAGVEIPYGKKAVLSAINGGESVGNVVTPVVDSTYYVSFVDDDSITEYGKRLFLIDFENMTTGSTIDDQKSIATYTDNFNGDWSHLTINFEAGTNTIAEENGNKFVKGLQNWAQIRINNANYATAPAGYYTMALRTKNYGYPSEAKTIAAVDQSKVFSGDNIAATWIDEFVDNGEWDTLVAEWDYATKDYTMHYTNPMTTDVAFDDIAFYYRPATVNLTVVGIDGEETVYENCDSVVDIDTLLADVTAPFGYKPALAIEKNGDPISGSINLVSDAKLYVVLTPDETVDFEYGKALFIIDFEREDMQGWAGTTIDVANTNVSNGAYIYTTASYYNDIFEDKNYRVRFVVNEGSLTDQKTVVDENGNHYTEGTATTKWPQVYQSNYGQVQYKAGYYTFMVDSKTTVAPASGYGFGAWTKPEGFSIPVNEWYTITGTQELTADGALHPAGTGGVWFNYSYTDEQITAGVTVSWDNAKLYYKPYTAKVELVANGAVVATKENVSTAGVLVSTLVDGVKVKGYTVTGVKLGTTTYGLEDTIKVPCDCQLELALEVQEQSPATPETSTETSIRTDNPMGIRFKASVAKAEDENITSYGWIVARADQLGETELTFDFAKKVVGYGRQNGDNLKNYFSNDDEYNWFTGVLYFSETEADGLPSVEKLATKLVARPFVVVEGETIYGEAVTKSIFDAALAQFYAGSEEAWVFDILDKVDKDANDIPDIFEE